MIVALAGLLLTGIDASGQSVRPACIDAYQTLEAVREEMFGADPDFEALLFKVGQRAVECEDLRELWVMRAELADRAKKPADATLARRRATESNPWIDVRMIVSELARRSGFDPAAPIGKRWALVAGSSRFEGEFSPLLAVEQDVDRMAGLLKDSLHFDGVQVAAQERFTMRNFRSEFAALRAKAMPEDVVVIYVASHAQQPLPGTKDDDVGFLVFFDSNKTDSQQTYETMIALPAFVQEAFGALKANRVVLILDTCYSGDSIMGQHAAGGVPSPALLDMLTQGSGRVVIAAAGADERAQELATEKQGALVYCLDKAISATPAAPLGQLFAQVESCVPKTVLEKVGPGTEQKPVMYASEGAKALVLTAPR